MHKLLIASVILLLPVLACGEGEGGVPTDDADAQQTAAAAGPGSTFEQPIPLNQPHEVEGWEITVLGHDHAQSLDFGNMVYGIDSGLLLVAVNLKARNISAGTPGDVQSLRLHLADGERRVFGFHGGNRLEESMPSFLGYPTSRVLPGGELQGKVVFRASASNLDWRLLVGEDAYFAIY